MKRRTLGLTLLIASLALLGSGLASMLGEGDTSGDVATVESALRPAPSTPSTPPPAATLTTTTTIPGEPSALSDPTPGEETRQPLSPPIGLRIGDIDVDAPVAAYGVNQRNGQMAVPDNVTEVGWYKFGPSPGEAGSAVLAAHVDLAGSGPGVFFDLRTLEEGDGVVVLYEDGSEAPFRVVARTTYNKDDLPLDVIFSREGPPVLTLITCGGAFNTEVSRYDSNIVVYAVPDLGTEPDKGSSL